MALTPSPATAKKDSCEMSGIREVLLKSANKFSGTCTGPTPIKTDANASMADGITPSSMTAAIASNKKPMTPKSAVRNLSNSTRSSSRRRCSYCSGPACSSCTAAFCLCTAIPIRSCSTEALTARAFGSVGRPYLRVASYRLDLF